MTFSRQFAPVGVFGILFVCVLMMIFPALRAPVPDFVWAGMALMGGAVVFILPYTGALVYWGLVAAATFSGFVLLVESVLPDSRHRWLRAAGGFFWLMLPVTVVGVAGAHNHGGWYVVPFGEEVGMVFGMTFVWMLVSVFALNIARDNSLP